ncbi:MAG TPA: hypothetical protein VHD33_04955 [Legionellaceae bacterium]|nr:hypothetical protein [Legionellaceae bacterium]
MNSFYKNITLGSLLLAILPTAYATLTICPSNNELQMIVKNASLTLRHPIKYDVTTNTVQEAVTMRERTSKWSKSLIISPITPPLIPSVREVEKFISHLIDDSLQLETPLPITSVYDKETNTQKNVQPFCSYVSTTNPELHVFFWVSDHGK